MNSTGVVISNLTFLNSPFWTIHPVYCSHVIVQNVTILAPLDSPNTDGINPDSSNDVCIEDCYISTGDDLIAIKSGWDEYGISFARPSTNIIIRRLIGHNRNGSGIAIGSEMSGGVSEVYAENLYFFYSSTAITIKTARGRGGYVRNIYILNVTLVGVDTAIRFDSTFSPHPDDFYDPNALPVIERITIKDGLHGTAHIFKDTLPWFPQKLVNLSRKVSTPTILQIVTICPIICGVQVIKTKVLGYILAWWIKSGVGLGFLVYLQNNGELRAAVDALQ
ncbi:putative polygalacturonase [Gossypium arboreum]|uniref:Putative polygalacturonase n=1 Tax=Gossypium arboreum TaxID=29729 RepID=A0A0B0MUU9_GOSAR|nr:putative polygalacturonase [Gossypium arboreum]